MTRITIQMRYKLLITLLFLLTVSIFAFSCKKNTTKSNKEPLVLLLQPTNATVNGTSDGSIDLTVSGGTNSYSFLWSNGATTEDIDNLAAGKYIVNVTDSDNETLSDSAMVKEPAPIDQTIFEIPGVTGFKFNRLHEKLVKADELGRGNVNITIFSGDDGNLIIDSGYNVYRLKLNDAIQAINSDNLKYIINTHNHPDHIGGNSILSDGGTIIGHENGRTAFQNSKINSTVIDVSGEYTFNFNGEEIKCFPLTIWGHTNTDIAVYFERLKILCMGDVYLSESFPSVTASRGATVQNAIKNYELILTTFPSDITIIPGHGRRTSMDELQSYLDVVNETVQIVRSHMAQGKSLDTIINDTVLKKFDKWGGPLAEQGLDTDFWIRAIYNSYSTGI